MPATEPAQRPAPHYSTRPGNTGSDREHVLAIWRGNLGNDARMPLKYSWFYEHAPAGAPILRILTADDAAVGTCAAGRRHMLHRGQTMTAAVLADLAVVQEHRALGPAMILQQALATATAGQVDLLYGFPNQRAVPVFKRMGYRQFGELVRHACVLRHQPYLRRTLPPVLATLAAIPLDGWTRAQRGFSGLLRTRLHARWAAHTGPEMDALWDQSEKPDAATCIRDMAHLRWRFDQSPTGDFRYLLLVDNSGSLRAWFVTRAVDDTLHVHDYWSLNGARMRRHHIAALCSAARGAGHAAVSLELASQAEHCRPWLQTGFRERSRRVIFGIWHGAGDPPPLHMTAGDEDE